MNAKVIVGALVVAIAATAGFLLQRSLSQHPALTQQDAASATASAAVGKSRAHAGDDVPASPAATASAPSSDNADEGTPKSHPIPETLPAISLPDRDGVTRPLSGWKGRPVIVNFWATWCGPCREEIPLLKALRNERNRDRLEIVGIAIDQRDAVLKYARDIGIDYPILIGEKEGYAAAEAFGVSLVLPFSVFADSKGRIVTLKVGELHPDEAAFILDRVRDIDTKRLELAAARQQIADKMRTLSIERGKHAAEGDPG
jgi:thiol-disulfide isomerase/thioredoxin